MYSTAISEAISEKVVQNDSLPPVYKHGCVILANQKIYCYGGANRQGTANSSDATYSWFDSEIYNHHVYLDVSRPLNVSAANTQWQPVPPPSYDFQLEPRCDFAMVNHNGTSYTIVGGSTSTNHGDQSLVNITVVYVADFNFWETIIEPEDASYPTFNDSLATRMFGVRGVKISNSEYMIAGGIPPNNNTVIQPYTNYIDVQSNDSNWENSTSYDVPIINGNMVNPEPSRIFRTALATSLNGFVYFFGGVRPKNAAQNYDYMDKYLDYYTFDTLVIFCPSQNQTFNLVKPNDGPNVPSPRQLHTVTSIPNTSKMLLYGGVNGGGAGQIWSIANFTNGDGAGRRYGHQAVMVGNELLYIIGGIDITNTVQNDVHILNVTSLTWLNGSYTNTYDQTNSGSSSSDNNGTGSSSLSEGAIAGIVIGCVAAVTLGTVSAVIFYMQGRNKKKLLSSSAIATDFIPPTTKSSVMANTPGSVGGSTMLHSPNPPADGRHDQAPSLTTGKPNMN
ncbi:uncharacterized protein BX664DRAFT_369267 [Halteromyces radiatus]|uniref:uncharacterized protein n=1 Tax=Halteromyces radiatus TaxID=101107 RepID=UPI00221ECC90|nr:uncharacterized protein BX664DRAFT_369267 [Halteromyces radiatus]KAI8078850.1 hypothetical protein BX664DRAFT_369267 [Halteromyces radiatus]